MNKYFIAVIASFAVSAYAHALEADMFTVNTLGKTFNITTNVPNHYYPSAGIKIFTSGYPIISGCTMIANGYCLFGVSDTKPASISFSGGEGSVDFNLCLDGTVPLSCQKYTQQVKAKHFYVTNMYATGPGGVEVCAMQSDGTLENCIPAGNSINNFNGPASISINAANTMAYVVNYPGTSISVCPIASDGTFANCIQNLTFNFSYGGSAISPDGRTLFVTNYNTQTVDACSIDPSNGTLGSCVDTGAGAGSTYTPYGMILNKMGTVAYVSNLGTAPNKVAVCAVTGTTFSCTDSGGAFAAPIGLAFSADESQVYVTNTMVSPPWVYYSISVCDVGPGGSLGCLDSGFGASSEPWGILVDGPNAKAYVSNIQDNSVTLCSISADPSSKGQLNACIDSGVGGNFNGPAMMVISE
ncbi:MAG: lactonase family protein [Gammaproteobacteria bacterium]